MEDQELDDGQAAGGGIQADLIKSYLAFARRAIGGRLPLSAMIFAVGLALTVTIAIFVPRTYACKTVLMTVANPVLDRSDTPNGLTGAEGLIMRHENLEAIIRETGLVRKFPLRRPPLLRAKDRAIEALFGAQDEKTQIAVLVGTLETRLNVSVEKGELTVSVEWSDGQTAKEIAEAARESFLRARHVAEISAFEDKMAILDGHATSLREEIAALAEQMNSSRQPAAPSASAAAPTRAPRPQVARVAAHGPDVVMMEEVSGLKEKLAADKPKLAQMESEWNRRLREEQEKLAEMKLRLTPSHPEVVTEDQKVQMLSRVPPDIAELRTEVATLESDLKQRTLVTAARTSSGGSGGGVGPAAEPLPAEIIQALEKDDVDPALRAQLSGAIVKYGDMRNDIRTGRIDLDTAQAAFNHRYQLVLPAEAPSKPTKPKPGVIVGAGLFLSLLLSVLAPVIVELRRGVITERWQVEHLQLPVLAELGLPPHNP